MIIIVLFLIATATRFVVLILIGFTFIVIITIFVIVTVVFVTLIVFVILVVFIGTAARVAVVVLFFHCHFLRAWIDGIESRYLLGRGILQMTNSATKVTHDHISTNEADNHIQY